MVGWFLMSYNAVAAPRLSSSELVLYSLRAVSVSFDAAAPEGMFAIFL